MKVGLLWFDDDAKQDLAAKIRRAAKQYRQKFGTPPDTCYVHHSAMSGNGQTAKVGQIQVEALPTVLLHHLWIGQEEQP